MINLARHLRLIHQWSDIDARKARGHFGLRKERKLKEKRQRQNYTAKVCPISSCQRVVKRLNNHMRQVHHCKGKASVRDIVAKASVPKPFNGKPQNDFTKDKANEYKTRLLTYEPVPEPETQEAEIGEEVGGVIGEKVGEGVGEEEGREIDEGSDSESELDDLNLNLGNLRFEEEEEEETEEIMPSLAEKTIFQAFKGWLKSLDGGKKKEKDARSNCSQVLNIKRAINARTQNQADDIRVLLDTGKIREHWLNPTLEKLRPGSIKAYIHALHHFYLFLLSVNTIVEINEQEIYKCQAKLKNWLKHIRKLLKKRAWQKKEEDLDKLSTPEEFKAFDKAPAVLEAKEILTSFEIASKKINRADYNTVRDFLITSLTIDNAPRSGVLASVTINALRKAERKGNTMQVTVLDHKTFESSGPANLCMPLETYRFLDTFVQKIRRQRVEEEEDAPYTDNVFITWNAQEMTSSTISGGLSSFWNKVTGHSTNTSLIRKSIVSIIHAQNPAMKSDLALHMNHSRRMADEVYNVQNKKNKSVTTTENLRKAIRTSQAELTNEAIEDIFSDNIARGQNPSMEEIKEKGEKNELIRGRERAIYDRIRYLVRKRKKQNATDESTMECDRDAEEDLEMNRRDEKCNELSEDMFDESVTEAENKTQKVPDNDAADDVDDDDEEDDEEVDEKPARKKFTEKENNMISTVFYQEIEDGATISRVKVAKKFKEHPGLKHILKKCRSIDLENKIRNMRRAYRNKHRK